MAGAETGALAPTDSTSQIASPPMAQRKSSGSMISTEQRARIQHEKTAQESYGRGRKIRTGTIKDKKLRANLKALEAKYKTAAVRAKDAEILLEHDAGFIEPEGELERTFKVRQDEIRQSVGIETAKKGFELRLEMGPYVAEYTRNGRDLLLAGRKGHVATLDWRAGKLGCELQLGETVRDAKWLHNNQLFAVAQKRNVYIYDRNGVEIHNLSRHTGVTHMEFLPYHFLLATIGTEGHLKYLDTSTGQIVAEHSTHLGATTSFCQNPHNAILHAGHQNGQVTLWSPNSSTPLVKMLTNRGPVRALAVDRSGYYMVTAGQDCWMKVWDIRNYKEVHRYSTGAPATSLAISDRNLTAVGFNTSVNIWRNLFDRATAKRGEEQARVQSPYMSWGGDGQNISRVRWCPFEDVLGCGHSDGFTSILVPGAGEPNFDALEVNPYESVKQRQETEVKALLNKLQPEMISLNPNFIGNLDLASHETRTRERDLDRKPEDVVERLKKKARGKNTGLKRYLKKKNQRNVITYEKLRVMEAHRQNSSKIRERRRQEAEKYGPALARFATGER